MFEKFQQLMNTVKDKFKNDGSTEYEIIRVCFDATTTGAGYLKIEPNGQIIRINPKNIILKGDK